MKSSAQIVALSGPSEGQVFPVDEDGIRLSDDCIVRLCDGRAVACGRRDGQETPWCLLDHNARIDVGPSEFRLEHAEIDPARIVAMFPAINLHDAGRNKEIQNYFLGILLETIPRPIAAAVLLDNWRPGETAFGTYFPGLFHARYAIVNETRRQSAPGIYDEAERVFCARLSQDNRYLGALYVKCLDAFPLRQDERIEITRIASYISIFLANAGTVPQDNNGVPPNGDPPEVEIVFEDPTPMYRFDQKKQRPVLEQVPSTLEEMLDSVVFGIFYDIEAAIAGGVCLAVPSRPGHFVRFQRPVDFEIDKEIIYRAFTGSAESVSNADGTVWAVPIAGREGKLGVVYMEIEKSAKDNGNPARALRRVASIAADYTLTDDPSRFL